jgi:hypothetical protein
MFALLLVTGLLLGHIETGANAVVRSAIPAFATIAGIYLSTAAARAAQVAVQSKCPAARLLVLKTDDLAKLAPGTVALASIATTNAGAQDSLVKLRDCGLQGYVERAQ